MKKLRLLVLLCAVIFGCSKEKIQKETNDAYEQKSTQSLGDDQQFINYLKDSDSFLSHTFDVTEIRILMKKSILTTVDETSFALALGFKSEDEFKKYAKMQAQRLSYLNNTYAIRGKGDKLIKDIILSGIYKQGMSLSSMERTTKNGHVFYSSNQSASFNLTDNNSENSAGNACKRRSYNCIAIATTAAVAGHIACAAVDFATIGISAYFCHGAVILGQIAMSDNCYLDFQACISSPPNFATFDGSANDPINLILPDTILTLP